MQPNVGCSAVSRPSLRAPSNNSVFLVLQLSPVFVEAFVLTFLAEWGDRSQIATIGRQLRPGSCRLVSSASQLHGVRGVGKRLRSGCYACHCTSCHVAQQPAATQRVFARRMLSRRMSH